MLHGPNSVVLITNFFNHWIHNSHHISIMKTNVCMVQYAHHKTILICDYVTKICHFMAEFVLWVYSKLVRDNKIQVDSLL
jgi:hypothetical protein